MRKFEFLDYFISLFRNRNKKCYADLLGFGVKNVNLYDEAFTSSFEHKRRRGGMYNNERLEYLGDAVLELAISTVLYEKYKDKDEGFLSSMRAALVRRSTLNYIGERIGLPRFSKSLPGSTYVNAYGNMFEALIGAVYIDRGFEYAMHFVRDVYTKRVNIDKILRQNVNYKSMLLEVCQKYRLELEYKLIEEQRLDNNMMKFQSQVFVDGKSMGYGVGKSKRASEQAAARYAIKAVNKMFAE